MQSGSRLSTRAIHAGDDQRVGPGVAPAIVQTATFELEDAKTGARLSTASAPTTLYTRWGNPNHAQAAAILANLEEAGACYVTASGMAAIAAALFAHLRAGDHVVAGDSLYSGTMQLLTDVLPRYGITTTFVDQTDLEAVRQAAQPETRVLYVETITNPTLRLADLSGLATIARQGGWVSMIDNTFATPANARPLSHGFDLVLHSLTKYLNGHSDIIAGAAVGSEEHCAPIWPMVKLLGGSAAPFDTWLLIRGLKSFGLRMARHNSNAQHVAEFLSEHPKVQRVHYPGLASHPQHALAQRQLAGGGGVVSFEVAGGFDAGRQLVEAVRVIKLAVSLGGVESLIVHAASTTHGMLREAERQRAGIDDQLIRLAIGIEDPEDLVADLTQALDQVTVEA